MSDRRSPEVSPWEIDARGLCCPMPVLLVAQALRKHAVVRLQADDPAARGDLEALCEALGHEMVSVSHTGTLLTALVRAKAR